MKSMEGTLKNIVLAGIGTVSYSYEKGKTLIDEMVAKGELTMKEGEDLAGELKAFFNRDAKNRTRHWFDDTINRILEEMHVTTKEETNQLKKEIDAMESRLTLLEQQIATLQQSED
ncbi:Polyhydroxyalkanoate synthesis regulator phasin [Tindallia magadiensis]|uniref:Polyhydroxyalkanoate synthesis regulator phasin n=1 Tax=Tindallia magadiensis TaxID=69895 RepID=A0A1I3DN01_9FIRM|nr:phasin family protein [Tindallia magadiensis]SFH88110.1 Polyhydroxyalkanoate synthesis regulator phasin [Tindallia magadiensis]